MNDIYLIFNYFLHVHAMVPSHYTFWFIVYQTIVVLSNILCFIYIEPVMERIKLRWHTLQRHRRNFLCGVCLTAFPSWLSHCLMLLPDKSTSIQAWREYVLAGYWRTWIHFQVLNGDSYSILHESVSFVHADTCRMSMMMLLDL